MTDYDVIVVGGGGAGLAAAIEARKAGASCIVLEADTKLGGATALSAGVFYAANTSVQRAAGIQADSADAMFEYIMALNHWALKPDLIRYICDQSGPTLEWLIALGTKFPAEWLVKSGVESVPRGHPSEGAGGGIAEALINAAGAAGIETAFGTRVERLLVEQGRVVGVLAGGVELRAPAVVITTGGFGNNPDMLKRLFPTAAQHGDWTYAVHYAAPFILGDGIRLGEEIGAAITGHDTGLVNPTPGFRKAIEAFLPPWTVVVNEQGRRFMAESAPYTISGYLVNEQTNQHAFVIFDEPTLVESGQDTRFADPYHSGAALSSWDERMLREQTQKGRIKTADTLEKLAARVGIDPEGLRETITRYNEDCKRGADSHFMKKTPKLCPVEQPPFYAVEIRGAIIGATGAGLDIDRECHVLDTKGRVIPGLFAAGEVLGVLNGKRYAGGGMSIGPAVILGRAAGRGAAAVAIAQRQKRA